MVILNSMTDDFHQLQGHDESSPPWSSIDPAGISAWCEAPLSRQRARLWALTLDSRGIPCQLLNNGELWSLSVPPELLDTACRELRDFERHNRNWPPQLPTPRPVAVSVLATLSVLLVMAVFYNICLLSPESIPGAPRWLEMGSANAARIREGEVWRAATALTLHADAAHLLGNLAIGGIFAWLLCRQLGSGLGWSLILLSGTLGNLLNSLVQPPNHLSIGASTAVFGTVGLLAAIGQLRYRDYLRHRWLLPIAGALTLLTILGSEGKNSDLGAHFFGLTSGVVVGWLAESVMARCGYPGKGINTLLALVSALTIAGAWWLAIGR